MSVSVCLSVCLSVTEVNWRIIANLGFKFRSKFAERGHPNNKREMYILRLALTTSRAMLATARPSCFKRVRVCTMQLLIRWIQCVASLKFQNKKHLKNVGPIHHCEPPHANSPDFASGTVARRLRIGVYDNADEPKMADPSTSVSILLCPTLSCAVRLSVAPCLCDGAAVQKVQWFGDREWPLPTSLWSANHK